MKEYPLKQAIKSLRILKTSLLTSLFFFTYHFLFSQCTINQVEIQVEVTTDDYGFEAYWEITEQNSLCGVNTVFSGGNSAVGCLGGGLQSASASDPGAYSSNNSTVLSLPFCLDLDSCYTFHMVDAYGDGGTSYNLLYSGINVVVPLATGLESQGSSNSVVFCATEPPAYDIALDVNSEDSSGWILNHIRPVPDPFYPIIQLNQNETFMGVNAVNYGVQNPTGVYVRLNIDKEDVSGNWNTVYTDTMDFSNVNSWFPVSPDFTDHHFRTKEINNESWYSLGKFRYQYIAHHDSADQNPSNDTITGYFTLTEDYWSRVQLTNSGIPFGTDGYLPGSGVCQLTGYEWGSFFYFSSGGLIVDELKTTFYIHPNAEASSFPYQARIFEVNSNVTGLDLTTDLTLVGIGFDTLSGNPGSYPVGVIDSIFDIQAFPSPLAFQDDKLYYISIYQENYSPPYLNDCVTRNGLYIMGETTNHDFHVYNPNSGSYPFYNPLSIEENSSWELYTVGWTNSPEPSFGIKFSSCVQNSFSTQTETECVSFTWAANGQTYTESGQYTEVLTDQGGCDSTVTLDLTIIPVNTSVININELIQSNAVGASYQWIDCNSEDITAIIEGETEQIFRATVNGDYAVIVTQNNCSDTSDCVNVSTLGINELTTEEISISPNPTKYLITIQSESVLNNKFKIFDQQGREVMKGKLTGKNTEVSLGKLSRGIYTIRIDGNYKPAVIIKQ